MLELRNVSSFYGNTPILHDVSFDIPDGELACVVGRNGVGKTTLANTILGLTTRMQGTLMFNGVDASKTPTHERALAGIGYVPQGRIVVPEMTVREVHDVMDEIEAKLLREFPGVEILIHPDPEGLVNETGSAAVDLLAARAT